MNRLLKGHADFQKAFVEGERAFLEHLASGNQAPDAMYVGCSDSRVIPELLTASKPGQLFVVRNVANLVPPLDSAYVSVGAALEYAVEVLKVPNIVVCGHYGCGGVRAVLPPEPDLSFAPSLAKWLMEARRAREIGATGVGDLGEADVEARWRRAVEANALEQLANLLTYPGVARRVTEGSLALHAWLYDMHDALLQVYDAEQDRFVPYDRAQA